jgi:hypothetical protein
LVSCVFFFHDLNMGAITRNSILQWAESIVWPVHGLVNASKVPKIKTDISGVSPKMSASYALYTW